MDRYLKAFFSTLAECDYTAYPWFTEWFINYGIGNINRLYAFKAKPDFILADLIDYRLFVMQQSTGMKDYDKLSMLADNISFLLEEIKEGEEK